MSDLGTTRAARYREVPPRECWELLASAVVGRLVWSGREGLNVATMNFAVDPVEEEILLRTLPYSTLARECDDRTVAFQVDEVDVHERSGWSVLVRGRAYVDLDVTIPRDAVDVWPEGSRTLPLRIVPRRVTGRRLLAAGTAGVGAWVPRRGDPGPCREGARLPRLRS